jgi:hypothetical protein
MAISWTPSVGAIYFLIAVFIFIFALYLFSFIETTLKPLYRKWRN